MDEHDFMAQAIKEARQALTIGEFPVGCVIAGNDRVVVAGTAPIPPPGEAVAPTAYLQMLRCGEIKNGLGR